MMAEPAVPPRFSPPERMPSLLTVARVAPSDPGAVLPVQLYRDFSVKLPGPGSPVAITDPATAERVLSDTGEVFGRNRQMHSLMRRSWNKGLAAAEGEPWLRQRRAVSPALRPRALPGYAPQMAAAAAAARTRWAQQGVVELGSAMGRVVSETVLTTLLTGADDPDYDQLAADIPVLMRRITDFGVADLAPLPPGVIDRLRGIASDPAYRRLRAFSGALATKRANGPDAVQDIPALIRGAGPLADNIHGFMMASFETTALAAAWMLYLLALYPDWQAAVRAEAEAAPDGDDRLDALPITRRIAKEAMRLYPPAPILARACLKPTTLLGHDLKPGQVVIVATYSMHRHEALWAAPDRFDPDRFAPGAPPRHRASYIPFSAGPRMCVAAGFAEAEIMVLVSELVLAFDVAPTGPEPAVSLRISTHSTTGLTVAVQPR